MPRVSIIVPNYNHAPFLQCRLESILNQTFTDFELLFLDDASTDQSLAVLTRYESDSRIRKIVNNQNSGSPFVQWNRGIDETCCDYVWIAESDDYSDHDFLQKTVAALDRDTAIGLVYTQSWLVPPDDSGREPVIAREWYSNFEDNYRWIAGYRNSGSAELANYLVFKNTIPNASAVVFRRSVLSDGLRAPEDMRLAGDWMFWSRLVARTDLLFLAEPLNYFRYAHSGSQRDKTRREGLQLTEGLDVYAFIDQHVDLGADVRRRVLRHQLKLWGSIAFFPRLSIRINLEIYGKLRVVHPEIRGWRTLTGWAWFSFYYLTAPLRRVRWLTSGYNRVKNGLSKALRRRLAH